MSDPTPDLDDVIAERAAAAAAAAVAAHEETHAHGSPDGPADGGDAVSAVEARAIAEAVVAEHANASIHATGDQIGAAAEHAAAEAVEAHTIEAHGTNLDATVAEAVNSAINQRQLLSADEIDARIAEAVGSTPPPVVTPPVRPPQPPSDALRLAPHEQLVYLDPTDGGRSWGPHRPNDQPTAGHHVWAQLIADGNRLQDGAMRDEMIDRLRAAGATDLAGYGLEWTRDAAGEWTVESFPMEDGTRTRVGIVEHGGRKFLRLAGQWKPDGYHPNNNNSPIGGVNLAHRRGPGLSGPMYYDGGPRTQYAALGKNLRCGPNANRFVMAIEFLSEEYMFGTGYTSGPMDLHAPGGRVTGPVLMSTKRGVCRIWGKSITDRALDYNAPGNIPNSANKTLASFDLAAPGESNVVIISGRCTVGAGSEFAAHLLRAGQLVELAATDQPWGYRFHQNDKNGLFYTIPGQVYAPHMWWPNENWNWDPWTPDKNVRRVDIGFASVCIGNQVDVDRMRRHALSF